jgi:hypothetical protein
MPCMDKCISYINYLVQCPGPKCRSGQGLCTHSYESSRRTVQGYSSMVNLQHIYHVITIGNTQYVHRINFFQSAETATHFITCFSPQCCPSWGLQLVNSMLRNLINKVSTVFTCYLPSPTYVRTCTFYNIASLFCSSLPVLGLSHGILGFKIYFLLFIVQKTAPYCLSHKIHLCNSVSIFIVYACPDFTALKEGACWDTKKIKTIINSQHKRKLDWNLSSWKRLP